MINKDDQMLRAYMDPLSCPLGTDYKYLKTGRLGEVSGMVWESKEQPGVHYFEVYKDNKVEQTMMTNANISLKKVMEYFERILEDVEQGYPEREDNLKW